MGLIYIIENNVTDKVYIGQTRHTLNERFYQHKWCATHQTSRNYNAHLYKAMRKYGIDHFSIRVIEQCSDNLLNDREQFWIAHYDSVINGYNNNIGGGCSATYYDEDVFGLWEVGLSLQSIATVVGHCTSSVSAHLKSCGVSTEDIRKRGGASSRLKTAMKIHRYSLDGKYIDSFTGRNDVFCKLGIQRADRACRGVQRTAGGYRWSYDKKEYLP